MTSQTQSAGRNVGICLLRLWLSFEVVIDHFLHVPNLTGVARFFSITRSLAVPCFLLLTFYLTAGRFANGDKSWLKRRYWRLGVPYFVWPLLYVVLIWGAGCFGPDFANRVRDTTEISAYGFDLSLTPWNLLRQYLCGMDRSLLHQFWFHFNLMVLTGGMFALGKWLKNSLNFRLALVGLFALSLVLEYSPINDWLFASTGFEVKYSYGRLAYSLAFAALGIVIGLKREQLAAVRGKLRWFLMVAGLFVLFFTLYSGALPPPRSFGYAGLYFLVAAVGTVTCFYYLPLERLPHWVVDKIEWLSRYAMGIYCAHLAVGWVLHAWVFAHCGIAFEGFGACILTWVVSLVLSWAISLLPWRAAKMLVT